MRAHGPYGWRVLQLHAAIVPCGVTVFTNNIKAGESLAGMLPSVDREPSESGAEAYTVQEASRILRTTERTIRRRLERGDLEGSRDPISGRWRVEARSVTEAMPERPPKASQEAPEASESAREYQERVEDLQRQLGRLEGARELEAITQSTLREQLQRERERADRLEEELRDARRSWWDRLTGR
jgi:hypothetical protein